jgi:hypothetical protein
MIEFQKEYNLYKNSMPSSDSKGASIILYNPSYTTGIVFSYGYLSEPKELKGLADDLFEKYIFLD